MIRRATIALTLVLGPAASTQTQARSLTVDGRTRTYLLHSPQPLPHRRLSLVLVFHGGQMSGAQMEQLTRFSELADQEGFVAVYPEAVDRRWTDGRTSAPSPVNDVHFVAVLLDTLVSQLRIDERRLYATGISNGGIFSHLLASRLSSRIAAIAPVAGAIAAGVAADFHPDESVSVLMIHGSADSIVRYSPPADAPIVSMDSALALWSQFDQTAPTPKITALADADSLDGCTVRRFAWEQGRRGTDVLLYLLEGGGHTWPGPSGSLPPPGFGIRCRDIAATPLIWEFFKTHSKS